MRGMVYKMNSLHFKIDKYIKKVDYSTLKPYGMCKLHYEYIKNAQEIQLKTDRSLYTEVKMMIYLFQFLENKDMSKLSAFTYLNLQELIAFLKVCVTKQDKPLSQSSQRLVYTFFKSFVKWLYKNYPDEAPSLEIFQKSPYRRNNAKLKTEYIHDDALKQIKKSLRNEQNIYTKAYIIVALYYGLRSFDIVNLTKDCIVKSEKNGKFDLHYIDHKQKEKVVIPAIAPIVATTLNDLIKYTKVLRVKSGLNNIFIKEQREEASVFSAYQKNMLDKFVKDHNITNNAGELIKLTSHMFRRTLATNMQSDGVSIDATQSILNHKHKRTTFQHYILTKEQDYIEQISSVIEKMHILTESSFKNNFLQNSVESMLRLPDGYCTNQLMLSENNYMCETYKARGNCYGCSQMVTTPKFLPYFEKFVEEKSEELKSSYIYGSHVARQIEYEIELVNTVINQLKEMND